MRRRNLESSVSSAPLVELSEEERSIIRIRELQRRVEQHNVTLLPETPNYVRMDGPRRQFRAYLRGNEICYEEL